MRYIVIILTLLTITAAMARTTSADDRTHFRFGSVVEDSTFTGRYQKRVLTEAFRRNGLTLEIIHPEDVSKLAPMVDNGQLDGDTQRVGYFARSGDHPGYVRIDFSTFSLEIKAFGRQAYRAETWADLGRLNARIGYTQGIENVAKSLRKHAPHALIRAYSDRLTGMRALRDGYIDIFVIANQYHARRILHMDEFHRAPIHEVVTLEKIDMYAFFARQHARLAPVIARTLRRMKREGIIDYYLQELLLK